MLTENLPSVTTTMHNTRRCGKVGSAQLSTTNDETRRDDEQERERERRTRRRGINPGVRAKDQEVDSRDFRVKSGAYIYMSVRTPGTGSVLLTPL